jgi:hypothetical protein
MRRELEGLRIGIDRDENAAAGRLTSIDGFERRSILADQLLQPQAPELKQGRSSGLGNRFRNAGDGVERRPDDLPLHIGLADNVLKHRTDYRDIADRRKHGGQAYAREQLGCGASSNKRRTNRGS